MFLPSYSLFFNQTKNMLIKLKNITRRVNTSDEYHQFINEIKNGSAPIISEDFKGYFWNLNHFIM